MKIRNLTLVFTIIILTGQGCYHYRVTVPKPDPATEYEKRTMHTFFWGLVNNPEKEVAEDCISNSIDEIRISTNYGYAFITVITLGIWAPIDVEWRCGKPPITDEDPL